MTEKYKNTKEALAAADAFALEKLHQGYEVSLEPHSSDPHFTVFYWRKGKNEYWDAKSFPYTPQPEIAKDTPMWVRRGCRWLPRYATGGFSLNGWIACYEEGRTSFTNNTGRVSYFEEYSLTDPNNPTK
jgi:hypothetical protein